MVGLTYPTLPKARMQLMSSSCLTVTIQPPYIAAARALGS